MQVLYEDNHIIIVNKESGEIVQGDKTGDTPLSDIVKAYIKERYHKPGNVFLGVVHRLDRPVQGLVLFAKTSKALSRLNDMFREKNDDLQKTYWAIVPSQHPSSLHSLTRSSALPSGHATTRGLEASPPLTPVLTSSSLARTQRTEKQILCHSLRRRASSASWSKTCHLALSCHSSQPAIHPP